MTIDIKEISEDNFNKINIPILFSNSKTNKRFKIISDNNYAFKLAWQSDTIECCIKEIDDGIYAIGVDQNFIIVNFRINDIILKLELTYFFCDLKIHHDVIYLATELEVILISKITFKIISNYELPDFFENINFNEKNIEVKYIGGRNFFSFPI